MKLPSLQFYPGDWHKDPGVRCLSLIEKGAWLEILLLMHESEKRGVLLLNGKPTPPESLAVALGIDVSLTKQICNKLVAAGVASIDKNSGAMVCRRMLRDEHIRDVRAKAGRLGGIKKRANSKLKSTPSFSTSISSSKKTKISSRPSHLTDQEFLTGLKNNPAYKHLNVDMELAKMDAWLSTRPGKKKTRRFIVAWLNRIDPGVGAVPVRIVPQWECFVCKKRMPEADRRTHMDIHREEVQKRA